MLRAYEVLCAKTGRELDRDQVLERICDYFHHDDREYLELVTGIQPAPQWHHIRLTLAAAPLLQRMDLHSLGASQAEALGLMIEELEVGHCYPDEAIFSGSIIQLHRRGELLAEIQPVVFGEVPEGDRTKIERALDGLLAHGESERWRSRLSEIRYLETVQLDEKPSDRPPNGHVIVHSPRSYRLLMQRMLDLYAISLPVHVVQECAASVFACMSWQQFVAWSRKQIAATPAVLATTPDPNGPWNATYYRDLPSAIYGFSQRVKEASDPALNLFLSPGLWFNLSASHQSERNLLEGYEAMFEVFVPSRQYGTEEFTLEANQILSSADPRRALLDRIGSRGEWHADVSRTLRRHGVNSDEELHIRDWVITRWHSRSHEEQIAFAKFDRNGLLLFHTYFPTKYNDSAIAKDHEGFWMVGYQHSKDRVSLREFSAEEVKQISSFTGLRMWDNTSHFDEWPHELDAKFIDHLRTIAKANDRPLH